ncbi:hypothetical protein N5079_19955 [Planotetraspora sp. A-T 1434]|uniref:hypothetical protein n=1 Tax=Planotetraspora sp. A-T 1434 TaxID=2979219 RepID=UPI0021BE53C7|nr:hypothetical protein [Planotetraspora sp. A-T 1434]MCT9932480.1 hypothetical protein [Planotetraspora sp. A-T 1434]
MTQISPTPRREEPSEAAFSVAIAAGMAMTAELVTLTGPGHALDKVGTTLLTTLTEQERGVLAAAVTLIVEMRNTPDDLSTLGHVEPATCPDPSCPICRGEASR